MHQVRSAATDLGPALFSGHPSPEDIVRFSLVDPELSTQELASIGDHVRACEACTEAVDLTRRADVATPDRRRAWSLPDASWLDALWPRLAPALAPALAVLVAVLAYPAYQGLTSYPALQRQQQSQARSLDQLRGSEGRLRRELESRPAVAAAGSWAGPARLLYLPAETRGVHPTPTVVWSADQLYQPLVIQHRPFSGLAPSGTVGITIRRGDGSVVWQTARPASELWDAGYASLVVLVPAGALTPGSYRVDVLRDGARTYQAEFTVVGEKK